MRGLGPATAVLLALAAGAACGDGGTTKPSPPEGVRLAYFGYAAVACDHDDPHDGDGRTDYSDEVAAFTNANQVCPTGDAGSLAERLRRTSELFRPILYVEPVFFAEVGGRIVPNPASDALWAEVVAAVSAAGLQGSDLIVYLVDEPSLRGVPVEQVEAAADVVRATYPDAVLMVIEAYDPGDPVIPSSVDWWGFNAYTLRDPAAAAWYVAHLDAAAARLREGQALVLVGDGIHTPLHAQQGLSEDDMAEVITNYHRLARDRPDVAALIVYSWPGGIDGPDEKGTRDLPSSVREAHRAVGRAITGK